MGVIQFNGALHLLKTKLNEEGYLNTIIPQEKPRCGGEVILKDTRLYFSNFRIFY